MDRYWLLTWTTYGTWLPGDERGFVSSVRDETGESVIHNVFGSEYDRDMPALAEHARVALKSPPICLTREQAQSVLEQFQQTAAHRNWKLCAAAVMANHAHIVVGVPGDPDPEDLLRDFKAYASRTLNGRWSRPTSETWWTESGSKRKLPDENAVLSAIRYVEQQHAPLALWSLDAPGERGV
jgi:REP element-mobilizing transposase RayT